MFTDKSFDIVGFDSQVSVAKSELSTNVQTTDIVYSTQEVQTVEKKNVETQTMQEQAKTPSVDYSNLAGFLKRVTPNILKALDEAYNTNAFDDYNTETVTNTSINLQLLQKLSTRGSADIVQEKISDLSWSSAGGTLAVSHYKVHDNVRDPLLSCDHHTKIQFYSLSIEDKFSDILNKTLEVNSCVTTLSYHSIEPSILAAGLANGDVLVWNLRNDDSIIPIQVCTHDDEISQIYWNTRVVNSLSFLVSSSKDGCIMVHKLTSDFTTHLHKRFKIGYDFDADCGHCITSFDFSWKDPNIFITGTYSGNIYKCSLQPTPFEADKNHLSPVIDEYDKHIGSIVCVKCSPTRNLFVTCDLRELRIYHFEQNVSQQSISMENDVLGLTWMVGNQDIFAAFGVDNTIKFYNATDGKAVTNLKIEMTSGITSLCVNFKRDVLAIADAERNVEIWKVPR